MSINDNRKAFHKLVRDNIPQIIENSGGSPEYRTIPESFRKDALVDKLREEVAELVDAETPDEFIEEAADIYEVLLALVYQHGFIDADLFLKVKQKKRDRGGFDKFVWLDGVNSR